MMRETLQLMATAIEQGWSFDRIDAEVYPAIKEALAQPEQEPVTWRNAAIRVGEDLCSVGPFGYYDMTAEQWLDWALSVVTVHAPPQRKWAGLTAEMKLLFVRHAEKMSTLDLIEEVDRHLKGSNT